MSIPAIYSSPIPQSFDNYNLFNSNVKAFLKDAEEVADSIVNRPKEGEKIERSAKRSSRSSVVLYSLGYSPLRFSSNVSLFTVNNYNFGSSSSKKKSSDDATRLIIGLVGTVIAGLAAHLLGGLLTERGQICSELGAIKKFKSFIDAEVRKDPDHPQLKAIKEIADGEYNIFKRIKGNSNIKVALTISTIVAGTFMALGAMAAAQAMVLTGGVIGFGTMLGALFNWNYKTGDRASSRDASAMLAALEVLKKADKAIPYKEKELKVNKKLEVSKELKAEKGLKESSMEFPIMTTDNSQPAFPGSYGMYPQSPVATTQDPQFYPQSSGHYPPEMSAQQSPVYSPQGSGYGSWYVPVQPSSQGSGYPAGWPPGTGPNSVATAY